MEEFDVFSDEDFNFSDTVVEEPTTEEVKEDTKEVEKEDFEEEDFDFNESLEEVEKKEETVSKNEVKESLFSSKLNKLGYFEGLEDEDGNPIDPETISEEEEEELLEVIIQNKTQENLKSIIENLPPELKELNKFVIKEGGNLKDYLSKLDTGSIDYYSYENLPDDKVESFLNKELSDLGYDEEDIQLQIETLKSKDKLSSYGQKRFSNWKKKESLKQKQLVEKTKEKNLERRKELEAFQGKLKNVLDSREISGLKLSHNKSKELYEYATKIIPSDNGRAMPQLHKDVLNAFNDPTKLSVLAAIVKDDFNLDKIAKQFKVKGKREITKKINNSKVVPLSELF